MSDTKAKYKLSNDKSKLLLYKFGSKNMLFLSVFDNEMKQLWQKQYELPCNRDDFTEDKFCIDNAGNVFMVGKLYAENKTKSKEVSLVKVFRFAGNGDVVNVSEINIDNYFITGIDLFCLNGEKLICAGYYTNKTGYWAYSIKGVFYIEFDEFVKNKTYLHEFSIDFIIENKNPNDVKNKKDKADNDNIELSKFHVKEIKQQDDNLIIIGEQNYSCGLYSSYGEILISSFNIDGVHRWDKRIVKNQLSEDIYCSYFLYHKDNELGFIFSDNKINLTDKFKKWEPKIFSFANGSVTEYTVVDHILDIETGNIRIVPLYTSKKSEFILNTSKSMYFNDGEAIFSMFRNIGKVILE